MAPTFPPRGGARGRSGPGLEPRVTAPGRAASRPIPRRKSFTNLTYARTVHRPVSTPICVRGGEGTARNKTSHLRGHTCPKSSYLYTRQAPQYRTPSTPPAASSVPAREMTFSQNWTGGLGAKRLRHGSGRQGGASRTCSGSNESPHRPDACIPMAAKGKETQTAPAAASTSPPQPPSPQINPAAAGRKRTQTAPAAASTSSPLPRSKIKRGLFGPGHRRTTAPGREACKDGPQLAPQCCTCSRTASVEPGSGERGKT